MLIDPFSPGCALFPRGKEKPAERLGGTCGPFETRSKDLVQSSRTGRKISEKIGGKNGRKRSLLVDARGVPLSLVVSGADTHDVKLLEMTLDPVVIDRPQPRKFKPQHLCADAGYKGKGPKDAVTAKNYRPHIKQREQEIAGKQRKPGFKARRRVVERTHSWLNRL